MAYSPHYETYLREAAYVAFQQAASMRRESKRLEAAAKSISKGIRLLSQCSSLRTIADIVPAERRAS